MSKVKAVIATEVVLCPSIDGEDGIFRTETGEEGGCRAGTNSDK